MLRLLRRGRPAFLVLFGILVFVFIVTNAGKKNATINKLLSQLERFENASVDLRFKWRGSEQANPNIAILAIDKPILSPSDVKEEVLLSSEALQAMCEKDFPWRRIVWAEALERLFEAGARVVAFDVVFASQNIDDPAFKTAIEKYRDRLVFAMTMQNTSADPSAPSRKQVFYPNPSLVGEDPSDLIGCVLVHPASNEDSTVRYADHFTSTYREMPDAFYDEKIDNVKELTGFAAKAYEKFTGRELDKVQHQVIRYQGPAQTYPYFPIQNLFDQKADTRLSPSSFFRDKLVFIGATYELAHDDKPTPFGVMAGVEVHAQIAANLLDGKRLEMSNYKTATWICFAAIALAIITVLAITKAWIQAIVMLGLLVGYVSICRMAFSQHDMILPMIGPLFGMIATGAFGTLLSFVLEQWEKAHTRKVLNRFVSKRIAAVILKNAEEFEHARRGEKRPVAIFFSDIRGFTTWTEEAEPEHLVGQLNEYFERMVTLIDQSEGTVQKFIGDAILAAWGDTHSNGYDKDVYYAVSTVLKIRPALRELNESWTGREDRRVISIGMGVNHGEVVVGEAGAFERREYTVLGDGVNFAARLESATKQFHTDCLVGQSVEELTRDKFVFRRVDYLKVKGKKLPVHVFTPLSEISTPPPEWLPDYHHAIEQLYWKQKFPEAIALFKNVKERTGGEDFLCDMYVGLCEKLIANPPAPDWDGSRELTEK